MNDILHLALGGCLKAPPVAYGVTADTGGHIAYLLEAAMHQAQRPEVERVTIVTRLFDHPELDPIHGTADELVAPKLRIRRIATANRSYLEKEALSAELPDFTEAFCAWLAAQPKLPDVIHAHFADAAAVAMEAQRRFGIPFVYTPHSLGIDKRDQALDSPGLALRIQAEREALRHAAAVIVSTREEAERQVAGYGVTVDGRIHVVRPGIPRQDAAVSAPTIADRLGDWLDKPQRPIILAVARPVAKKNLAALVRAFAGSQALRDRANLVILAGQHAHASGEEAAVLSELTALAATPELRGRIALPSSHDAADVAALYARAAEGGVFANPALHEPFGLTLVEAAAAGVPVVATGNGGPAEILATIGHGLLVEPRDERQIADALLALINDPRRHEQCARAARAGARLYSWDAYARASNAIYAGLSEPMLLVCDIDNTLTGSRPAALNFARWRASSPLPFIVATGRSLDAARLILRHWRLPEPDAFIVDVGTRIMRADPEGGFRECGDYAAALDANWDRAAIAQSIAPLAITPQPPSTDGPHKISFFGDAADAAAIRARLDHHEIRARVIHSHGRLIDVVPVNGGKAAAIASYAASRGFTLANCVAAGDSGNDVDMLAACGSAIVVGNAEACLDALPARPGLHRVAAHHAAGVLEGLTAFGLATSANPMAAEAA